MYISINKITYLIIISLLFLGCSKNTPSDPGAPYTIQVLTFDGISPSGDAKYKLTAKLFSSLREINKISGDFFSIAQGGELSIKESAGSMVQSNSFTRNSNYYLNYKVKNGVIIPLDYTTLAMFSAYYQFETVLKNLPNTINVKESEFFTGGNFEVLFEPKITLTSSDISGSVVQKINAAFIPGQRQFVLFNRSNIEHVPLSMNLLVLAHEFGHFVFENSFYQNKYNYLADYYNGTWDYTGSYTMRGINEGFADFFSYLNSGVTDILRSSINIDSTADDRNFAKITFTYNNLAGTCGESFYCLGTIFAKTLYNTHLSLDATNKNAFGSYIVKALSKTIDGMENLPNNLRPIIAKASKSQIYDENTMHPNGNDILEINAFLYSLADNLRKQSNAAVADAFCTEIIKQFGYYAFNEFARTTCKAISTPLTLPNSLDSRPTTFLTREVN